MSLRLGVHALPITHDPVTASKHVSHRNTIAGTWRKGHSKQARVLSRSYMMHDCMVKKVRRYFGNNELPSNSWMSSWTFAALIGEIDWNTKFPRLISELCSDPSFLRFYK